MKKSFVLHYLKDYFWRTIFVMIGFLGAQAVLGTLYDGLWGLKAVFVLTISLLLTLMTVGVEFIIIKITARELKTSTYKMYQGKYQFGKSIELMRFWGSCFEENLAREIEIMDIRQKVKSG